MKRSNFADPKEKLTDPLTFQITNIRHSDEKYENIDIDAEDDYDSEAEEERVTDSEKRYKIQLFGVTKGGHTVQVNICDFTPFFFVEVPDNFTEAKTKKFVKFVKNMLEVPNCKTCGHTFGPTERWCKTCKKSRGWFYQGNLLKKSCKLLEKEKMVGFTNHKKFKFIRLVFNNHTVMRRCSWMFNKPLAIEGVTNEPHQFVCHESNIEPVMRWLHIQKIEPAGWVTVNDFVELQPEYSTCNFVVRSSFMSVKPANDVEGIAPIMCAAFDIECTSKDGGFPKANRIEDAVIMVCTTFRKYPDTESCYKVCHTLKDSKPIEGCEIVLCKSEKDLLIKWRNLMQQMDPDFIYGYNSNGFDFKYMYDRAVLRRCESAWLEMSRCVYEPSKFELKKLSSSALGDNVHKFVDMKGRIVLDVMKEIQKEHKLDSYKLDAVAEHFTGDHKEDLSPQELFANYHKGKKKNIHEIAVYCLKDTELCHDLAFELAIVVKAMKMANVCTVPTEYIFYRGQGVKIFSLMAKECRKRGMIMPVIKRPYNDNTPEEQRDLFKKQEQFQGALVIETDGGLYYDPIVVLDFNSLYPSCQLGWNISHDTLVIDKKYDNLPGIKYETVSYTDYDGKQVDCRYVQNDGDTNKGLIPIVVGHLLDTRKAIKKKLKNAKNAMEALLLDCEQLAFKVVANSMFGQTGAATSPIYLKHIAACTTAKGREMLYKAKNVAEAEFENVECVYGDSVMGYTPLMVRNMKNSEISIIKIQDLGKIWENYDEFKAGESNRKEKQQAKTHFEVWTDQGWSPIRRVIKHKTKKKIFRILTHTGLVDVTEDHSLLTPGLEKIKPEQCNIGSELLHSFPDKYQEKDTGICEDEAFVMGLFFGDGSCGFYNCKSGNKYSWAINNADEELLNITKKKLENTDNKNEFKILDTMKSSGVYKLVIKGGIKEYVERYRKMFYDNNKQKRVPSEILMAPKNVRKEFWNGYYAADGDKDKHGYTRCDIKGQIGAMGLYYLISSLGYNVSINIRDDKQEIYRLTATKNTQRKNPNAIKKIKSLGFTDEDFVYDLETECGRFHAGIGKLIVKNTDSNFYKIKGLEYLEDKKKSLEEIRIAKLKVAIGVGHEMSTKINAAIGKPGIINFAYEKTFFPFLIVTKKRYYGILYEEDPTKGKPKVMGLAIKRRNYCKYTKEIMQGLLDKLMENVQVDPEDILGFIRKKLMKLIEEKVSFDELVITNTLRSEYKNPGSIAHKCLADRMVQRGETVNANDRIPYIYAMHAPVYNTRAKPRKQKIADIVEHPKYAKENGIKYDPEIYITGQIVEPVSQILGFVIDNPKEVFDEAIQKCWERKWKIYGPPVKAPIQRKAKAKPETKKAIKPKLVSISDSDSE